MITSENSTAKPNSTLPPRHLAEEIERALEMMRRVKRVKLARGNQEIQEDYGNTYVLPEPIYYPVSKSS